MPVAVGEVVAEAPKDAMPEVPQFRMKTIGFELAEIADMTVVATVDKAADSEENSCCVHGLQPAVGGGVLGC